MKTCEIVSTDVCYVTFEFVRNNYSDGKHDQYYRVTQREGSSGESPKVDVHFDGHAFDDAQRELNRAVRTGKRTFPKGGSK